MITIIIIITIICFLLILVVLAQNSKGGGLTSQFGGSSTSQLIGVKKTGDFLEKFTWGLAIALFVLTLSTDFFIPSPNEAGTNGSSSPNIDRAQDRVIVPPTDLNLPPADGDASGTTEVIEGVEAASEEESNNEESSEQ